MKYILSIGLGIFLYSGAVLANFVDIDPTHPYFYGIQFLSHEGIIEGYPVGDDRFEFRGIQPVLRSEALKMLLLSAGKDILPNRTESVFSDITGEEWFAPYVWVAQNQGIVSGFPDGTFHPEYTVSRAEFLKMLFLSFNAEIEPPSEDDVWYRPFLGEAMRLNIIQSNETDPAHKMARGEVAELIYRTWVVSQNNFEDPYEFQGFGRASYYGFDFADRPTASGEIYDPMLLTAAHRTFPFGTYIRVSHEGKSVIVKINDRGPYHSGRVLDLSQKAFEILSPLSRGVIDIDFEVVSGPEEEKADIPEFIQEALQTETQEHLVPREIESVMKSEGVDTTGRNILFDSTVTHLPQTFFPGVVLRKTIPQIIPEGSVKLIRGRAEQYGYKTVHFFLERRNAGKRQGEQVHFSAPMSGKNFEVPIQFLEAGTYQIGMVFDDEKKSRIETIEVRPWNRKRWFPSTDIAVSQSMDVRVVPDTETVRVEWKNEEDEIITQVEFIQSQKKNTLYIEDGIEFVEIPYSFFDTYNSNQELKIVLNQARAKEKTLETQVSNWKYGREQTFLLMEGFPDKEKESVSVFDFKRYHHTNDLIRIKGQRLVPNIEISGSAYLQKPSGIVEEIPVTKIGDLFELQWSPREEGVYVFQLLGMDADTLFKRAVYVFDETVLPIKKWTYTKVSGNSVANIHAWIDLMRYQYNRKSLPPDSSLESLAQEYAEHLAENDFIAHTDLKGRTFRTRLETLGLIGEFGENLSMAETVEGALQGLEISPSHRHNILLRRWNRVGVGIATSKDQVYVVQIFGEFQ